MGCEQSIIKTKVIEVGQQHKCRLRTLLVSAAHNRQVSRTPTFYNRVMLELNRTNLSLPNCFYLNLRLEQTNDAYITSVVTCILNAVFSLITTTGNLVILFAIRSKQELHTPSFILLFCLAASDLVVGLVCQPFYVAYKIAELTDNYGAYCVLKMIQSISGWTATGASLATLSGVSIDRLLVLTLHLRYNTFVTVKRIINANCSCFLDLICVNRLVEILDSPVAYLPGGDSRLKFSCHNHEHLENISDRSQTSTPNKPAKAQCSKQHCRRAQMQKVCYDCTLRLQFVRHILYTVVCDHGRGNICWIHINN